MSPTRQPELVIYPDGSKQLHTFSVKAEPGLAGGPGVVITIPGVAFVLLSKDDAKALKVALAEALKRLD